MSQVKLRNYFYNFHRLAGLLLILVALTNGGTHSFEAAARLKHELEKSEAPVPVFVNTTNTTVVTSVGQTIYLYCGVQNLGDRAVSWIRSRDLTILTIGLVRYTRDQRFTAIHGQGTNNWGLKIVDPNLNDSGLYECQISYHDDTEKKLKMPFTLQVLESRAKILGSHDLYMKEGSEVELSCKVVDSPGPPAYIYWYKGEEVINYSTKKGIEVSFSNVENNAISTLLIKYASPSDSGNYTCAPANALQDSLILNVIKGEKQAGLQEIANFAKNYYGSVLLLLAVFLLQPVIR